MITLLTTPAILTLAKFIAHAASAIYLLGHMVK